jgi:hypothetical protein
MHPSDSDRLKPLELKTCRVSCTAAITKIKKKGKGPFYSLEPFDLSIYPIKKKEERVHFTPLNHSICPSTPLNKLWLDLVPQTIGTSLNYPLTGFARWFWWYGCRCRAVLPCKQHMSPLSSTTSSLSSFLLHPWRGSSTTMKLTAHSEQHQHTDHMPATSLSAPCS